MLIWTRAEEDRAGDLQLLRAHGFTDGEIFFLPTLRTEILPVAIPPGSFTQAVVTSQRPIAMAGENQALMQLLAGCTQIHTHGRITAELGRQLGLPMVLQGTCASAEDLGRHLHGTLAAGERILVLTAEKPAFDLAGYFAQAGRPVTTLVCYRTLCGPAPAAAADSNGLPADSKTTAARADLLRALHQGVIAFASPSAVTGFVAAAPQGVAWRDCPCVTIGGTTAHAAAQHFTQVHVSPQATLVSLVNKARAVLDARPGS